MRALKPTPPPEDPKYRAEWETFHNCRVCGRRVRPQGRKVADAPNTVSPAGKDICQSCYHNAAQRGNPAPRAAVNSDPSELRAVAATWSEDEHSVAFWVAGKASNAAEAKEILASLGLFDFERRVVRATVLSEFG
jgi:hypothetical protein